MKVVQSLRQKVRLFCINAGCLFFVPIMLHAESPASGTAQHDTPQIEAEALWALIEYSFAELRRPPADAHESTQYTSKILKLNCDIDAGSGYAGEILRRNADDTSSDWGLEVRGAYTNRTIDQDGDSSAYVELSWNILKEGFYQRTQQAKTLRQKAYLATKKETHKQLKLQNDCRKSIFRTLAARNQSLILTHKLALMRKVFNVEHRAYFKGWSYFDDYLVAESELKDVQQKLKRIHQSTQIDKYFSNQVDVPIFDIDLEMLVSSIREKHSAEPSTEIKKQIVRMENESRYNDRLRVFIRNSFDVDNDLRDDAGVAYGVRFTIPLTGRKDSSIHYKLLNIDEKNKIDLWERLAHTRQAYHEFKLQLEQTEKSRYAYLRAFEKMRRVLVQHRIDNNVYLPVAVKLYMRLLDRSYSFQDAKIRLYQKANNVFSLSRLKAESDYITRVAARGTQYRARLGERSMYVWSKEFNRIDNQDIFDLMLAKGIQRMIISSGKNTHKEKLQKFLGKASRQNLNIELITGSNQWIFPENHTRASDTVSLVASYSENIHLDIEPHTLPGYQKNKEEFIGNYLDLLRQIRKNNININLSVSVPVHWPESVYSELNLLADRIYLMAYETNSPERIKKRIQPAINTISRKKIVLALRTEDFKDEWELEKTYKAVQAETGINRLAIHSLQRYINLTGLKH